jgi:hypothetical protein
MTCGHNYGTWRWHTKGLAYLVSIDCEDCGARLWDAGPTAAFWDFAHAEPEKAQDFRRKMRTIAEDMRAAVERPEAGR